MSKKSTSGSASHLAQRVRAFENVQDKPCPVCLELMYDGKLQPRAVMPLPKFPPRLRKDGRQCCRDCAATDTTQALVRGQNPDFAAARLTIANDRCEGLVLPLGFQELRGLCAAGYIAPCSNEDLPQHLRWLKRHKIPTHCICEVMEPPTD
jgi:hypothetical protein